MPQTQFQKAIIGLGGAALMGAHLIFPFLHGYRTRWGSTVDELKRSWMGDEFVPTPRGGFTHAITIHASASQVWPWVAQIGQDKGGFYSYEFLENLVGCDIHNADRLVPEWQSVKIGDTLRLHPMAGIPIQLVEPRHGFVMNGVLNTKTGDSVEAGAPLPADFAKVSWLFYVNDIDGGASRFISRWRVDYPPCLKNEIMLGRYGLEPIAAVMGIKMMKGIKYRAERSLTAVSI